MAAPVPAATAAQIAQALAPLRARFPATRWLPPDKLHLTLVFLGWSDSAAAAACGRRLAAVAARHAPFEVATAAAGGRVTDRRGGVAWLRLADGASEIAALSLDIDATLESATYKEGREPRPHLTLARGVDDETISALGAWAAEGRELRWRVDRVVLFRSHLGPRGSRYRELASHGLTSGAESP